MTKSDFDKKFDAVFWLVLFFIGLLLAAFLGVVGAIVYLALKNWG